MSMWFLLEQAQSLGTGVTWLDALLGTGTAIVTALGGWQGVRRVWDMFAKKYQQEGFLAAAQNTATILGANRELIETLYDQFKAVVRSADLKDKSIAALKELIPAEKLVELDKARELAMARIDVANLPPLDLALMPFKDIVNANLVKNAEVNDKLLKQLVTAARADESAAKAVDRVAGILGAVAGEGLNLGSRIVTGGTVSASDIVGFIAGVGSTALGAKPPKPQ